MDVAARGCLIQAALVPCEPEVTGAIVCRQQQLLLHWPTCCSAHSTASTAFHMASIIAYLENYVESTLGLPSDLSRFLNMIKVLDARTAELMDAIKHTTDALCRMEPAAGSRKGGADEQEYLGLVSSFKRQEALLYQLSEEKVQLAQHALELITSHQRELDATTAQFEEEVAAIPTAHAGRRGLDVPAAAVPAP
ncbi:hypothetical protein COO60DRAFT_979652 [Scenedesmus sp. NREL 46B-D3]|nr:hypothetical protein COO60DRAFT_979652 [Scenedesmus sp. NREL 46B-D3]